MKPGRTLVFAAGVATGLLLGIAGTLVVREPTGDDDMSVEQTQVRHEASYLARNLRVLYELKQAGPAEAIDLLELYIDGSIMVLARAHEDGLLHDSGRRFLLQGIKHRQANPFQHTNETDDAAMLNERMRRILADPAFRE